MARDYKLKVRFVNNGHGGLRSDTSRGIGYKEEISARKRFPARAIWHQTVDPRTGRTTVYASSLTNVTDLAFDGRTLYAVQISTEGLLTGPTGSVVEVRPGPSNHTTVAGGLFAPYGIAISNGSAYRAADLRRMC
jgi:hypothetical protein